MRDRAGGHADDVDAGQVKQLAVIGGHMRHAIAFADACRGFGIQIADADQFDVMPHQLWQQHLLGVPAAADPDHAAGRHARAPFR